MALTLGSALGFGLGPGPLWAGLGYVRTSLLMLCCQVLGGWRVVRVGGDGLGRGHWGYLSVETQKHVPC